MIKKLTGIILVITLFLSLFTFTALGAATEHVINGGFEVLGEDGKPEGWGLSGGELGNGFYINAAGAHSGNLGLCIKPKGSALFVSQSIKTFLPGEEYQFTGWLKVASLEGNNAEVKLEFGSLTPVRSQYSISTANNTWSQVSFSFTAPAGETVDAALLLRNTSTSGEIYWDDISITGESSGYADKPQGSQEILQNGGFEDLKTDGANLQNWVAISTMGVATSAYTVSSATDNVRSGNRALKITATGGNPFIKQSIFEPEVGATYQISMWYKITTAKANPGFKIEWYSLDESGNNSMINSKVLSSPPVSTTTTGWVRYSYQFVVPEGCDFFTYYVRMYTASSGAIYEAYFDDASCYIIKNAPVTAVTVSTDEIFYYSDMENGIATAKANLEKFPNISSLEFKLKDEETILDNTLVTLNSSEEASWRFNLSLMTVEKKEYQIEAIAKDPAGNVLGTAEEKVLRYKRPTMLRDDGTVLINNQPFYPVFAYHVYKQDLQYAAQIGINTVQVMAGGTGIDYIKSYLDEADKYDIKCLVPLYPDMKPAGHPDNIENTISTINELNGNYDNILGWMVMDEATAHWPGRWDLFYDSYKLIRDLDIDHPVYILQNIPAQFANIGKYADILAYDPYTPLGTNMAKYVSNLSSMATSGVSYRKPVWCLNKAYGSTVVFDPTYNTRPQPTIMEERHVWYQALFSGASVVGFYSFSDAILTPRTAMYNTQLWPGLLEFAQGEMAESYNYFLKNQYPVFSEGRGEDVWWSTYVKNGSLYMIVLNQHESIKSVTIPIQSDKGSIQISGYTAERIYGGTELITGSNTLNITLEANGAYVYKITPNNAVDFSSLSTTKFSDLADSSWASEQIRELESLSILEGVTKTAYRPNEKITRGDFAEYLTNALGFAISIESPDNEISRQEMMNICKNELAKINSAADYIMTEISAKVKEEVLKGNINQNENVTRAETAYVLERMLELLNTPENINSTNLYKAVKRVLPEDIGIMFSGLTENHTNEIYTSNLWYKTWTVNGKQYVLVQNIDSAEKTVEIEAVGTAARVICKGLGSSYQENILNAKVPSNGIVLFEILSSTEYGVYDNNIMLSYLESGNFKIKYSESVGYTELILVALYREDDSSLELINILETVKETDGWSFTVPTLDETKNYIIKSLMWDNLEGLQPNNQAFILS